MTCNYERDLRDGESRQAAVKRELEDTRDKLQDVSLALGQMIWASEEEASALIRRLRTADDPMDELCRATQQFDRRARLSEHQVNRAILPMTRTKVAYELFQRHGQAYPILIAIDSASFAMGNLPPSSDPPAQ